MCLTLCRYLDIPYSHLSLSRVLLYTPPPVFGPALFLLSCLRQVLHALQMWSRKSSKMTYMNLKGGLSAIEKDKVRKHLLTRIVHA